MTERAMSVQVHRQVTTLLDKCQRLGPVTARGEGRVSFKAATSTPGELAALAAEITARERVIEMGGDTVVFLQADLVAISPGAPAAVVTVQVQGVALRCN
jgi:hypothetical protein